MDLRWMLQLYPRAWRDRYEDEVRALLEQRGASLATPFDLSFGALDAHLDPAHLTVASVPGAGWIPRVRLSNRMVFWAFPLFVLLYGVTIFDEVDGAWDTLRETDPIVAGWPRGLCCGRDARSHARDVADRHLPGGCPAPDGWIARPTARSRGAIPGAAGAAAAMGISLHATGRFNGQPLDSCCSCRWSRALLTLPLVVGRAVARDALGDRAVYLTQAAAGIVAAGMVAHLSGLLVSQAVASVLWPGGNWSVRLVVGLLVLLLPIGLAVRATFRGIGRSGSARRSERPVRSARGQGGPSGRG